MAIQFGLSCVEILREVCALPLVFWWERRLLRSVGSGVALLATENSEGNGPSSSIKEDLPANTKRMPEVPKLSARPTGRDR